MKFIRRYGVLVVLWSYLALVVFMHAEMQNAQYNIDLSPDESPSSPLSLSLSSTGRKLEQGLQDYLQDSKFSKGKSDFLRQETASKNDPEEDRELESLEDYLKKELVAANGTVSGKIEQAKGDREGGEREVTEDGSDILEDFFEEELVTSSWNDSRTMNGGTMGQDTTVHEKSQSSSHHPYMGARDENGNWGYIHDPTYLKQNPLKLTYYPPEGNGTGICDTPYGMGEEGYQGLWGLHKIQVVDNPLDAPRVLCITYTHSNRHHLLQAVVETYGQRCDGFLAASNQTNRTIGAVDILHEGNEGYDNIWQKLRSTWAYVYKNYLDDFDFFFIAGDNTFVVAENLKHAVSNLPNKRPIYLGQAMVDFRRSRRYCGGGAGYVLNRLALRRLIEEQFHEEICFPDKTTSQEDRMMGHCMRFGVANCTHSTDEGDHSRFHPMDVHFHATYNRRQKSLWMPDILRHLHKITASSREYLDSISSTSVSFHLVRFKHKISRYGTSPKSIFEDKGMRRYHAIVHDLCPNQKKKKDMNPKEDALCRFKRSDPFVSNNRCREEIGERIQREHIKASLP